MLKRTCTSSRLEKNTTDNDRECITIARTTNKNWTPRRGPRPKVLKTVDLTVLPLVGKNPCSREF